MSKFSDFISSNVNIICFLVNWSIINSSINQENENIIVPALTSKTHAHPAWVVTTWNLNLRLLLLNCLCLFLSFLVFLSYMKAPLLKSFNRCDRRTKKNWFHNLRKYITALKGTCPADSLGAPVKKNHFKSLMKRELRLWLRLPALCPSPLVFSLARNQPRIRYRRPYCNISKYLERFHVSDETAPSCSRS